MGIPGGSVITTWQFHCWGPGWIPSRVTKILEAMGYVGFKKEYHYLFKPENIFMFSTLTTHFLDEETSIEIKELIQWFVACGW